MTSLHTRTPLVQQKSAAFEHLQAEFESSFRFLQEVHGQRRFSAFPVRETVHYLHALWICDCKDRLLSISRTIQRYEGTRCLDLLSHWQEGETAEVIAFLQQKLDTLPFADLTSQLQQAQAASPEDAGSVRRLVHGRQVLLHRGMNLLHALEAICVLSPGDLLWEVQEACRFYGHDPSQITHQQIAWENPLYACVPHRLLARRNMQVMNTLGKVVMTQPTNRPGERSWKAVAPARCASSFAEEVIRGYVQLTSPTHNNVKAHRFVDLPEQDLDSFP